ncbi:hypothetical protein [Flaviaesturariibacter aridisoli]|nr:hypothetical protein [Flaviaesturariibacter aridisoli]
MKLILPRFFYINRRYLPQVIGIELHAQLLAHIDGQQGAEARRFPNRFV